MTNKVWTNAAQFNTYEEADSFRKGISDKHALVKVKRGFKTYRVKVWDPAPEKGKSNKKRLNHGNKKVRNRPKQS
jgi:hypothetical protein